MCKLNTVITTTCFYNVLNSKGLLFHFQGTIVACHHSTCSYKKINFS